MAKDATHDPLSLYHGSLEHISTARLLLNADKWAIAMYVSGLAVECMLQAIALRDSATHDARHDLVKWLGKCPPSLQDAVKTRQYRVYWDRLFNDWNNRLRYYSEEALLGYLRKKGYWRTLSGTDRDKMKASAQGCVTAAEKICNKGIAEWLRKRT